MRRLLSRRSLPPTPKVKDKAERTFGLWPMLWNNNVDGRANYFNIDQNLPNFLEVLMVFLIVFPESGSLQRFEITKVAQVFHFFVNPQDVAAHVPLVS